MNLDDHLRRACWNRGWLEILYRHDTTPKYGQRAILVEWFDMSEFAGLDWDHIRDMQSEGYGVHYGLIPRNIKVEPEQDETGRLRYRRGKAENAFLTAMCYADVDRDNNPGFDPFGLSYLLPNVVVSSGGGWHLYWYLKIALRLDNEDRKHAFTHEINQIAQCIMGDKIGSLDHTLRLPKSKNLKANRGNTVDVIHFDNAPFWSTPTQLSKALCEFTGRRYTPPPPLFVKPRVLRIPTDAERQLPSQMQAYLINGAPYRHRNSELFKKACWMIELDFPGGLDLIRQRGIDDDLPKGEVETIINSALKTTEPKSHVVKRSARRATAAARRQELKK